MLQRPIRSKSGSSRTQGSVSVYSPFCRTNYIVHEKSGAIRMAGRPVKRSSAYWTDVELSRYQPKNFFVCAPSGGGGKKNILGMHCCHGRGCAKYLENEILIPRFATSRHSGLFKLSLRLEPIYHSKKEEARYTRQTFTWFGWND